MVRSFLTHVLTRALLERRSSITISLEMQLMPTSSHLSSPPPDVVIIYRNPLFAQGIESLLRAEGISDVVKVAAGERSIPERIRALDPPVVVIEDGHDNIQELLPPILAAIPWVVRVGLDGAPAEIYRRAHHAADRTFVRLITRIARRVGRAQAGGTP